MDRVDVVFCCDSNYLKLLPTVLNSISKSKYEKTELHFHLMHDASCDSLLPKYQKFVLTNYKNFQLSTYKIEKKFAYERHEKYERQSEILILFVTLRIFRLCTGQKQS